MSEKTIRINYPYILRPHIVNRWELPQYIPWALVEPYREQIEKNHSQTLERVAERGGLSPGEIYAASEGKYPTDIRYGEIKGLAMIIGWLEL